MNIFYLDSDPKESARQICNVHVNKMIIESCQMLSTSHHVLDGSCAPVGIMKKTHENHPSSIWVRQNKNHYKWLYLYTLELCSIYTHSSGKLHKCFRERLPLLSKLPKNLGVGMYTPPPRCMPENHQDARSVVKSYRSYLNEKYLEWSTRDRPIKIIFHYGRPEWLTSV